MRNKLLITLLSLVISNYIYCAYTVYDVGANPKLDKMSVYLKLIESHTNTLMSDQKKEMTEELQRWNNAVKTNSFYSQLDDFADFANDFRNSTNSLMSIYQDTNSVQKDFYDSFEDMFSSSEVIAGMSLNEINKKNTQIKSLTENVLKDSNQLLYYMLGNKAKDVKYQITQADILSNLTKSKITPKELLKGMTQAIVQSNQILLELKAVQTSLLQQTTQMQQEEITQKKLTKEKVMRDTEKSYNSLKR